MREIDPDMPAPAVMPAAKARISEETTVTADDF